MSPAFKLSERRYLFTFEHVFFSQSVSVELSSFIMNKIYTQNSHFVKKEIYALLATLSVSYTNQCL